MRVLHAHAIHACMLFMLCMLCPACMHACMHAVHAMHACMNACYDLHAHVMQAYWQVEFPPRVVAWLFSVYGWKKHSLKISRDDFCRELYLVGVTSRSQAWEKYYGLIKIWHGSALCLQPSYDKSSRNHWKAMVLVNLVAWFRRFGALLEASSIFKDVPK